MISARTYCVYRMWRYIRLDINCNGIRVSYLPAITYLKSFLTKEKWVQREFTVFQADIYNVSTKDFTKTYIMQNKQCAEGLNYVFRFVYRSNTFI